jgi:hypothetical protein
METPSTNSPAEVKPEVKPEETPEVKPEAKVEEVKVEDDEGDDEPVPALQPAAPGGAPKKPAAPRRARISIIFDSSPMARPSDVLDQWNSLIKQRGDYDRMHCLTYSETGVGRYISLDDQRFTEYMTELKKEIIAGKSQTFVPKKDKVRVNGRNFYNLIFYRKFTAEMVDQGRAMHVDMHAYCVMDTITVGTMLTFHRKGDRDKFSAWLMKDIAPWEHICYTFNPTSADRTKLTAFAKAAVDLEQASVLLQWATDTKDEPITEDAALPMIDLITAINDAKKTEAAAAALVDAVQDASKEALKEPPTEALNEVVSAQS